MTQDQYGQARDSGYVVHGQVVGDEIGESADEQDKPMTRFQKVASALRGDKLDRDEPDTDVRDQALADQTGAAAGDLYSGARQDDYWDTLDASGAGQDQVAGDVQDPTPTQPDMYGTAAQGAPEMRPGEAAGTMENLGDLAYADLLPDASVYTEQWQQIQFKFVDDPHASVTEAAEVVAQVTTKLETAIQERQRAIEARQQAIQDQQRSLRGRWGEGTQADTETLRETLRMYKAFLDQLVGAKG